MRLLWSPSSLGALVSQAFLLAFQIPSTAGKSLPHRVRDIRALVILEELLQNSGFED